ncbi:glycosyltransferase [Aureliella helgolandensis]|uniref:glycosyltransferase n=1 Tax=Aureliella helgolandensis TaxID=2527968 RepID=UPI0018D1901C|nr:glycosyltransferase [Aureliella helgolandensis]
MPTKKILPARTAPLRVKFVLTSLPVGGAETLLLNLISRLDRQAFQAEVVCLKEPGQLGIDVSQLVPVHSHLLNSKWDLRVLPRLVKLFRESKTDVVVTVGAGDKMFWGRLAAYFAKVPVVCSALHSTGWPDGVGRMNRWLTSVTDGFIACAASHAKFLVDFERFPKEHVFTIPNGIDTSRFHPDAPQRDWLRTELGVASDARLVGIVAALRSEKNHLQFVEAATQVIRNRANTHFVIIGEGPERASIEKAIEATSQKSHFHLLGNRHDTERCLAALDVFCLTSKNEANPVSILEALACEVPVVAPNVGSISETVINGKTGLLTSPMESSSTAAAILTLLSDSELSEQMGRSGRQLVAESSSLERMVQGYETLWEQLYNAKAAIHQSAPWKRPPANSAASPNLGLHEVLPSQPDVALFH